MSESAIPKIPKKIRRGLHFFVWVSRLLAVHIFLIRMLSAAFPHAFPHICG
jgi:hypothetical protein